MSVQWRSRAAVRDSAGMRSRPQHAVTGRTSRTRRLPKRTDRAVVPEFQVGMTGEPGGPGFPDPPVGGPPQPELSPEEVKAAAKRKQRAILALTLVMLIGIGVIVYPFAGGWFNSKKQAEAVTGYVDAIESVDAQVMLEKAREYNANLPVMPIGDFYTEVAQYPPEYQEYLALPGSTVMGRLTIPKIEVDLPIYHGTSDDVLMKGVGHLYGTHLPVGGPSTHAALSAHSGMLDKRMFDRLPELKVGDHFFINVLGEELAYQVVSTEVYTPEEGVEHIVRVPGEDLVTLITCTPYGINTHRLLVTGSRVDGPAKKLGYEIGPTGMVERPWWIWPLIVLVLIAIGIGAYVLQKVKRQSAARLHDQDVDDKGLFLEGASVGDPPADRM